MWFIMRDMLLYMQSSELRGHMLSGVTDSREASSIRLDRTLI
jgi:hypothetical protein